MIKSESSEVQTKKKDPFIKTFVIFIVIALALRASVVEAYKIPSGSMLPTLQIGDHILVTKFNYAIRPPIPFVRESLFVFRQPKRGDIVVFTRVDNEDTAEDESDKNIIKRVIGLPGETLEVLSGKVFINGTELIEPYAVWTDGGLGNFGPYNVPADHVLVLGDNRDQSKDSRFWHNPYLPIKLIKGQAQIVYFNINKLNRIGTIIK